MKKFTMQFVDGSAGYINIHTTIVLKKIKLRTAILMAIALMTVVFICRTAYYNKYHVVYLAERIEDLERVILAYEGASIEYKIDTASYYGVPSNKPRAVENAETINGVAISVKRKDLTTHWDVVARYDRVNGYWD